MPAARGRQSYIPTHMHTNIYAHRQAFTQPGIHTKTNTGTYIYTHMQSCHPYIQYTHIGDAHSDKQSVRRAASYTHMHTNKHARIHIHTPVQMHNAHIAGWQAYIHRYTHIQPYTNQYNTHIHTIINTHIQAHTGRHAFQNITEDNINHWANI